MIFVTLMGQAREEHEEGKLTHKSLPGVQSPVHLAQKVGKRLGKREVLQQALSPASQPS